MYLQCLLRLYSERQIELTSTNHRDLLRLRIRPPAPAVVADAQASPSADDEYRPVGQVDHFVRGAPEHESCQVAPAP